MKLLINKLLTPDHNPSLYQNMMYTRKRQILQFLQTPKEAHCRKKQSGWGSSDWQVGGPMGGELQTLPFFPINYHFPNWLHECCQTLSKCLWSQLLWKVAETTKTQAIRNVRFNSRQGSFPRILHFTRQVWKLTWTLAWTRQANAGLLGKKSLCEIEDEPRCRSELKGVDDVSAMSNRCDTNITWVMISFLIDFLDIFRIWPSAVNEIFVN